MVWIHGGAFKMGSADDTFYGPDYLLEKNVVYVSMNYRLGALGTLYIYYLKYDITLYTTHITNWMLAGFLSINDRSINVPGNAGLKDQTLALKWVRANIDRFGGDAFNVTLFGESAGAGSVHFHMVSELSRGLFDKAIVQSGSMLCNWANCTNDNWADRLAKKLGWTGEGGARGAYEVLRKADAKDIVLRQNEMVDPQNTLILGFNAFGPVQEPYRCEHSFVSEPYNHVVANAWSVDIPLIIGGNSHEGLLLWKFIKGKPTYAQSPMGVHALIGKSVLSAKPTSPVKVLNYYYGGEIPREDDLMPLVYMWGDRCFWHGINAAVEARLAKAGSGKTFVYRFAAKSKVLVHFQMVTSAEYIEGI